MRANVARLGALLVWSFLIVALALGYWILWRGPELSTRADNPRQADAERQTRRGALLDRNGVPLAWSVAVGSGFSRKYASEAVAPVTGFYSVRFGTSGLEQRYDLELRGERRDGALRRELNRLLHRASVGSDVVTTIDFRIQNAAYAALAGRPGAIVVLDPRNGEVLALASAPSFDPSLLDLQFQELRDNSAAPLFNRATQSAYVPGSTFKIVTAAAALDRGLVDAGQTFRCTRAIDLGGQTVDCRNNAHVPVLSYAQAFAWSSNRTFALSGLLLGFPGPMNPWLDDEPPEPFPWVGRGVEKSARVLEEYGRRFGFDQDIPFDLPVEPGHLKRPDAQWSVGLLAATAFGQGELQTTPLQMLLITAAVANDGRLPRPVLVTRIRAPDGSEFVPEGAQDALGVAMRPETAHLLQEFMVEGVNRGYAAKAAIAGLQVAGKTGTAETTPGRPPHAWFVGFAPAEAPRVAIVVVLEQGGSGSEIASPVAGEILRQALEAYPHANS